MTNQTKPPGEKPEAPEEGEPRQRFFWLGRITFLLGAGAFLFSPVLPAYDLAPGWWPLLRRTAIGRVPALAPVLAGLGVVAWFVLSRLGRHSRPNAAGFLLALACLLAGVLFPVLAGPPSASRVRCASGLKQIGYGCHLYATDHDERFPPSLGHLYPDCISDGCVFLCPVGGRATAVEDTPDFSPDGYTPAMVHDAHTDFVYVSGLKASHPAHYVLAFDEEWNHAEGVRRRRNGNPGGLNVLYVDGRVEFETDIHTLHEKLRKQAESLRALGIEMKVLRPQWSTWPEMPEHVREELGKKKASAAVAMLFAILIAFLLVEIRVRTRSAY